VRALALAAALSLACRARHRPLDEAPRDVPAVDAGARDATPDVAPPPLRAFVTVTSPVGDVRLDTSLRCEGAGAPETGVRPAAEGDSLVCGDRVETSAGASVTLRFASGAAVALGEGSVAEVPGHAGAALVVSRGTAEAVAPFEAAQALRVDAPAGRVIVSAGAAWIAVADDGAVRVSAVEGAVTLWPSPPPRAAGAGAAGPRAVASRGLSAGASLGFSPEGARLPGVTPRATGPRLRAAIRAWLVRRNAVDGRGAALAALMRAGEEDVRDLRALLDGLRVGASGRDRDAALGALSLALGRLHARARRARALGDAGALSPFEALRDEARRRAP
jgi:hypothetical protein